MIKLKDILNEAPSLAQWSDDKKAMDQGILEIDRAFKKAGYRVLKQKDYKQTRELWEGWYTVRAPKGQKVVFHLFIDKRISFF